MQAIWIARVKWGRLRRTKKFEIFSRIFCLKIKCDCRIKSFSKIPKHANFSPARIHKFSYYYFFFVFPCTDARGDNLQRSVTFNCKKVFLFVSLECVNTRMGNKCRERVQVFWYACTFIFEYFYRYTGHRIFCKITARYKALLQPRLNLFFELCSPPLRVSLFISLCISQVS